MDHFKEGANVRGAQVVLVKRKCRWEEMTVVKSGWRICLCFRGRRFLCFGQSCLHPPPLDTPLYGKLETHSMDYNASVAIPQHDFPKYGSEEFTAEEEEKIQRYLEQTVGPEDVRYREGPAKST